MRQGCCPRSSTSEVVVEVTRKLAVRAIKRALCGSGGILWSSVANVLSSCFAMMGVLMSETTARAGEAFSAWSHCHEKETLLFLQFHRTPLACSCAKARGTQMNHRISCILASRCYSVFLIPQTLTRRITHGIPHKETLRESFARREHFLHSPCSTKHLSPSTSLLTRSCSRISAYLSCLAFLSAIAFAAKRRASDIFLELRSQPNNELTAVSSTQPREGQ